MELKEIEIKVSRATTLPILPVVATEMLRLLNVPTATAGDYERVIIQDMAMSTKILRTANSAYFGSTRNITTLQRAFVLLGTNTIRSICMTVALKAAMMSRDLGTSFCAERFFRHSLAVACTAKILARLTQSRLAEEAFIAGLMHDIGKPAISMFLPMECAAILQLIQFENLSEYEAETAIIHVTHEDVGRMAAKCWGLPEVFSGPISHHHHPLPEGGELDLLTAFVHAGNVLAHQVGLSYAETPETLSIDPEVMEVIGIPEAQYEPIKQAIAHEVFVVSSNLGIAA